MSKELVCKYVSIHGCKGTNKKTRITNFANIYFSLAALLYSERVQYNYVAICSFYRISEADYMHFIVFLHFSSIFV